MTAIPIAWAQRDIMSIPQFRRRSRNCHGGTIGAVQWHIHEIYYRGL
jgi:hypothetical protein